MFFTSSDGLSWWLQSRRIDAVADYYLLSVPALLSSCRRRPDSVFAMRRTEKHLGGQPHLISGAIQHPAPITGGPHQVKPSDEDVTNPMLSFLWTLLSDCGIRRPACQMKPGTHESGTSLSIRYSPFGHLGTRPGCLSCATCDEVNRWAMVHDAAQPACA